MASSTTWLIALFTIIGGLFFVFRLGIRKFNAIHLQHADTATDVAIEEIPSGEPPIPKTPVSPEDLGGQFIKWLQTEPPSLPLQTVPIDRLTTEFVYLQIFTFDLASYLKLGDSYNKKITLDVFWDYITGAGVYTETFQLRMLYYTDAVKAVGSGSNLYEALGAALADQCGAPGDTFVTKAGADIVQQIINRLNHLFDHVTLETSPPTLSTLDLTPTL